MLDHELVAIVQSAQASLEAERKALNAESERVASEFIFYESTKIVAALSKKCALVWKGNRLWFALKRPDGSWMLVSRRDAEIALGQYHLCSETERVMLDSRGNPVMVNGKVYTVKRQKYQSGLSVLVSSPDRPEYQGAGHYGSPARTPAGHLDLGVPERMPSDLLWLYSLISTGRSESSSGELLQWPVNGGRVSKADMLRNFREHVPSDPPVTPEGFAHFLRRHIGLPRTTRVIIGSGRRRESCYELANREDAVRAFQRMNN